MEKPATPIEHIANISKKFVNEKITEYGSDTNDYDFGVIANWKLNRSFSFYTQLEYLKYFERENYTINFGINLIII